MSEDAPQLGRIQRTENGLEGRLERQLDHPPAAVWELLTQPGGIGKWLAPGTIELRKGGRVHIDFGDSGVVIDSEVLEFEAERLLAYSWSSGDEPARPLRWELSPTEGGTKLVLTVQLPAGEDIAKACAGYDAHLEMLAAALEGVPIKFPFALYQKARQGYLQALEG